ncbi:DUF4124 domain-containing protein [Dyella ginsengisoli]|uniref:DUF4124 domain-containing protein n=1 Tax=Dyella ginsengisoli TaxID=363848 RepID=A0ABW8JNB4_9GAMM
MRKAIIIITAIGLGFSGLVQARQASTGSSVQYRWHDAQGLAHYSDSLSADAMANGYDVVNSQGLVMRHVDRPLTPAERAAAKKQADEAAVRKREEEQRQRDDQQMLAAYPDEASFVAAQNDELGSIDQQVSTTRISLGTQEKALADLLDRAGELERAKQPVPKFLSDKIAAQRNVVGSQRALLDRLQASYVNTQLKHEAQLQRYRQLKAQLQQANGDTAQP